SQQVPQQLGLRRCAEKTGGHGHLHPRGLAQADHGRSARELQGRHPSGAN
ncbi:unnamed protein product, partial [Effrenium voratum]